MLNVGIFLFNGIELLDFAGPYEVFSVATELNNYQLFNVFTITENGADIRSVNGLRVIPDYDFKNHPHIDVFIVPGGNGTKAEMNKDEILQWLKEQNNHSQITMSICSGTRLLGKMGLLDNLNIITHHEVISDMQEIAPTAVIKKRARFVDNGKILTSAGISAGIELSLYVVAKLYGKEVADKTAKYMEYGNWEEL
ncbi:DJ-1/PfpI family protein [Sporomusa acidovorans]|uniref:Isonitrile hydratase n=1 Tax=Sporomusa acidovorans (strain ATCC 49682 / DSM 3132 / Mol) TaxID=1123286 RepID=A0ABZ3JBM2_SPOA4|nr:DJ-1/PfpI family protein [Sporomusa acidovorans]OZC13227.1 isonitrile hydratase [Sporomusa acidovorans DSM 3132]SDE00576.1 DJ-1/PfpI family protein [Sporomusa acidovorans]